jgi:hypothetical protein
LIITILGSSFGVERHLRPFGSRSTVASRGRPRLAFARFRLGFPIHAARTVALTRFAVAMHCSAAGICRTGDTPSLLGPISASRNGANQSGIRGLLMPRPFGSRG